MPFIDVKLSSELVPNIQFIGMAGEGIDVKTTLFMPCFVGVTLIAWCQLMLEARLRYRIKGAVKACRVEAV